MHQLEKVLLLPDTMQTVGIIGLGYVGLPTAIGFHDAGFTVWELTYLKGLLIWLREEKIQQVILMLMI